MSKGNTPTQPFDYKPSILCLSVNMSAPIISSFSWLSFCHKNAAVAANSGILKHLGEM
jgi:hypothetical protein